MTPAGIDGIGSHPPSPIGIIAGRGLFPHLLLDQLTITGRSAVVAGLKGQFVERSGGSTPLDQRVFPLGALGALARYFTDRGVEHCILAGGVDWRTARSTLKLDRHAWSLLPQLLGTGDNRLLTAIAEKLARLGVSAIDAKPFVGPMLVGPGQHAGPPIGNGLRTTVRLAWNGALALGQKDRGQAAIAFGDRLVGLETRAGTDALIARAPGPGAVLAKIVKPGQDTRFDMPTIGPTTVRLGAAVGLSAIAVEADGVLLLQRDQVIDLCHRHGISLISMTKRACDWLGSGATTCSGISSS